MKQKTRLYSYEMRQKPKNTLSKETGQITGIHAYEIGQKPNLSYKVIVKNTAIRI
jgi:hypothetical protein